MFIASKLLSFATQPLFWAIALLALGLWLMKRWPHWGQRACSSALVVMVLVGWLAPPEALLRHLEEQHPGPAAQADLSGYAGVVVLGGAMEPSRFWERPGPVDLQVALNAGAERMTAPVALLRQHPQWRVLFTGGEGELNFKTFTEAERAKAYFHAMGVGEDRLLLEDASRTTFDNAVLSAHLPGVDITKPWLLITSAWHMPRAMAVFRKAGWNVTPYPVDYRSSPNTAWLEYSLRQGADKWQVALHEIVGLWAYRLAGRA
ncbi:MAG: hypothetical protein RL459_1445 [Pseudomonadota bacterium]